MKVIKTEGLNVDVNKLHRDINSAVKRGEINIIIDFEASKDAHPELLFILIKAHERCTEQGGIFRVTNCSTALLVMFDSSNVSEIFL